LVTSKMVFDKVWVNGNLEPITTNFILENSWETRNKAQGNTYGIIAAFMKAASSMISSIIDDNLDTVWAASSTLTDVTCKVFGPKAFWQKF
jgi:hypothetical protein